MSRLIPVMLLAVAAAALLSAVVRTQPQAASWLDEPKPASWNKPGLPIPAAPKIDKAPRCRTSARQPELAEDKRLQAQGWDLVGAYQGLGGASDRGDRRLRRHVPAASVSGLRLCARGVRRHALAGA